MSLVLRRNQILHDLKSEASNLGGDDLFFYLLFFDSLFLNLRRLKHVKYEIEDLVVKELVYSVITVKQVVSSQLLHILNPKQFVSFERRLKILHELHQALFVSKNRFFTSI